MLESPLRFFSIVASLLIIAGWLAFAIDQTRDGSDASQQGITGQAAPVAPAKPHHTQARRTLDSIDRTLESPFRGITGPDASLWVRHSVPAIIALLAYGFGVGYLSRFMRGSSTRPTGKRRPQASRS